MYYVYVLISCKNKKMYIGSSAEPEKRLKAHNAGRGEWSKRYRPWERVILESYSDREAAERREKYLKSGWGRRWIKQRIESGGVAESG